MKTTPALCVSRNLATIADGSPSPLWGGDRGGGKPHDLPLNFHPTRNPSPSRGGESTRRSEMAAALVTAVTASLVLLPEPALAAGGGDVSPFVYQFMVFIVAIFVGY